MSGRDFSGDIVVEGPARKASLDRDGQFPKSRVVEESSSSTSLTITEDQLQDEV